MDDDERQREAGRDADQLELLDRIEKRVPELDLKEREVDWMTLPDGAEGLLVDGGGVDRGDGALFANAGDDLHAYGPVDPIVPDHIGCVRIKPDGSRELARVMPDPASGGRS